MGSWLLSVLAWMALLPATLAAWPWSPDALPSAAVSNTSPSSGPVMGAVLGPVMAAATRLRPDPAWEPLWLGVAFAGPAGGLLLTNLEGWHTGLAPALWLTIALCLGLFGGMRWHYPVAARLSPLLMPYLLLLGGMALILSAVFGPLRDGATPRPWIMVHIAVSVVTYALVTLAGIAALAAFLQERALRRKRPSALTRALPALAQSEWLQIRLLGMAELVLSLGLMSGMLLSWQEHGRPMPLDHKSLLSLATFILIGALLWVQVRTGLRGRQAGRLVLVAYLLLTLAYPGVKFVSEIVLRRVAF